MKAFIRTQPKIQLRAIASIIDYIPQFFFWYIYTFGEPDSEGIYTVNGWKAFPPIVFWFSSLILPEFLTGKSLGKLIFGLKVVDAKTGKNLSIIQATKRRGVDFLDLFFFGIVAYINVKNTPQHQRLGDLWSKAIVVGGEETICTHCGYEVKLEPNEVIRGEFECPNCNEHSKNHII